MKNKKFVGILVTMILLLIGAGVTTVSAEALGDGYSIYGYNAGWIFIVIAVIYGLLVYTRIMASAMAKKLNVFFIAIAVIGIAMVAIQVEEPTTGTTTVTGCPDFDFDVTVDTNGAGQITGTVWDDDTNTLTIPLTVSDSSDGNLTGHITGFNVTIDPLATAGMDANDMTTIYYKSTNYDMKYGGEKVFDETGGYYDVEWTDDGGTDNYDGSQDIQMSTTGWAVYEVTFNNGTAGNWVTELSQIGDSISWEIQWYTDCGIVETWDVVAIVVSYTA